MKKVTICVCTYGDNLHLISRCISTILGNFNRNLYELRVGCNDCPSRVINFLNNVNIDKLIISKNNLYKNGMMKHLYTDISSEYVFWFDDDSHVKRNCLDSIISIADNSKEDEAIFGTIGMFPTLYEIEKEIGLDNWIKQQIWYKNKSYPNFENDYSKKKDGFYFVLGGNYFIKTKVLKKINWPSDPTNFLFKYSRNGEDIILGEAIHQNGYKCVNLGVDYGVVVNDSPTRCS